MSGGWCGRHDLQDRCGTQEGHVLLVRRSDDNPKGLLSQWCVLPVALGCAVEDVPSSVLYDLRGKLKKGALGELGPTRKPPDKGHPATVKTCARGSPDGEAAGMVLGGIRAEKAATMVASKPLCSEEGRTGGGVKAATRRTAPKEEGSTRALGMP